MNFGAILIHISCNSFIKFLSALKSMLLIQKSQKCLQVTNYHKGNQLKVKKISWEQKRKIPVREWTSSDVSTSYRFAVLSHEAVTACFPPTNQSAAITTPWWLLRDVKGARIVGQSLEASPSPSGSSLSENSISSSPDICC